MYTEWRRPVTWQQQRTIGENRICMRIMGSGEVLRTGDVSIPISPTIDNEIRQLMLA